MGKDINQIPTSNLLTPNLKKMSHIPVLLKEAINLLKPQSGQIMIDGTAGRGGHAREIQKRIGKTGKLLLIDWDQRAIARLQSEMAKDDNIVCVQGSYAELPEIMERCDFPKADGLILDLGVSSEQLEESNRGFSFQRDEPLLMTYSDESESLERFLKHTNVSELTDIISKFGEERYARRIAEAIVANRAKIANTKILAEIIKKAVPRFYERSRRHGGASRIHPATRTFQALRIYLNQELANLEKALSSLDKILKIGGRATIISFHSLEDRIVKRYFNELAKQGRVQILTKKPIIPAEEEIKANPRARSAKLRAATIT